MTCLEVHGEIQLATAGKSLKNCRQFRFANKVTMPHQSFKAQFPIFAANAADWTYLDSAATSQKPAVVIERVQQFYAQENANVHRATHASARRVTHGYEQARETAAEFIGASAAAEIIWTKGATEAINLLSYALESLLENASGRRILLSESEHHANIVPWQQLAARKNMRIDAIPVDQNGAWDLSRGLDKLDDSVAIVSIGQVSNALGNINPIEPILSKARDIGAITIVDGAQAVAHMPVNVQKLDCDFYVFSGHKIFGPTGVGVLYGKAALLSQLAPFQTGGEMIAKVTMQQSTFLPPPQRFETGTPNIAGVLGLASALEFVSEHRTVMTQMEALLSDYLREKLADLPGIRLWGDPHNHIATAAFTFEGLNNQDIGILLDQQGIAVRVGHHCAMPLMQALNLEGTMRASLGPYNTVEDIERLREALIRSIKQLGDAEEATPDAHTEISNLSSNSWPLAEKIAAARGWDHIYREVMLAGKALARHPEIQTPEYEVFGCESRVWLKMDRNGDEVALRVDSPSKVVRGLLAVMLEPITGRPANWISEFDIRAHLNRIGLSHHLSESRGNGLNAVWQTINNKLNRGNN